MKRQHFFIIILLLSVGAVLFWTQAYRKNYPPSEPAKIAAILPLSGPTAFMGDYCRKGIELAEKHSGGAIEVTVYDSKNDPKEGLASLAKARLTAPSAVISAMSSVSMSLAPVCEEARLPLMATTVSASRVTEGKAWMFRLFINADIDAKLMATFAKKHLDFDSIGVVSVNDEMGASFSKVFAATLIELGGNIAYAETYEKQQTDFKNLANIVASKNAKAIYWLGSYALQE